PMPALPALAMAIPGLILGFLLFGFGLRPRVGSFGGGGDALRLRFFLSRLFRQVRFPAGSCGPGFAARGGGRTRAPMEHAFQAAEDRLRALFGHTSSVKVCAAPFYYREAGCGTGRKSG